MSSLPALTSEQKEKLIREATRPYRIMLWTFVFLISTPFVIAFILEIMHALSSTGGKRFFTLLFWSKLSIALVFYLPLTLWYRKKVARIRGMLEEGVEVEAIVRACPLKQDEYGTSQHVEVQWEGNAGLFRGFVQFAAQKPLVKVGEPIRFVTEKELPSTLVLLNEGLPVVIGSVKKM